MGSIEEFETLITQLMSPDNNLRGQAEATFNNAVKQAPDQLILSLVQLLRSSGNQHVRELSCILLRKTLIGKAEESNKQEGFFWHKLSATTRQATMNELLAAVQQEELPSVRKKLADAISELALFLSAYCSEESIPIQQQWSQLLPTLFQLSRSENDNHRKSALDMFSKLCLYLGDSLRTNFDVLKEVLASGLKDHSLQVRLSALGASVSFVQLLDSPQERDEFKDFIPLMFEIVSAGLNAQKEKETLEALQILVELAEVEPTFLRPHLATVINAMLTIANTSQLADAIRQLGLEFLVTLAEQRPGMVRKIPSFVQNLIPVVLNFMLALEDDPEWEESEDDEDSVEVRTSEVGDECMDRLALALGGKTLTPILFNLIPSLLSHEDWKHRHTGLMAISLVGEGCSRFLKPHLGEVLDLILPKVSDPHPRVRWAACNTIGQMSSDFGPTIQRKFHDKLIPALVQVMEDKDHPRVQSHAASAVINFCEHCTSPLLEPYLDGLLGKLVGLLQGGKKIVQEQAITAVAAIADVVEDKFTRYYDTFIPFLKNILFNATGKEFRLLRGKAMECISLIGVSVGKEKFSPDAREVIEVMLQIQQKPLDADDPQVSFLLQAWARICKALGSDFVPYLRHVMPSLMHSAKLDPEVTIVDDETEQEGFEYSSIGDKRIGINTSILEEKATACNMIYQYASELKEGFFPYVEEVATVLIPLMKFYFHDGVRSAAVSTMPSLLVSTKAHITQSGGDLSNVATLFGHIFNVLTESIQAEMDLDILLLMIETLYECVEACGDNVMTEEQMLRACETILKEMRERDARKAQRFEEKQGEDFDEEEAERLVIENEKEEEVLAELAELVGKIAKTHKASFLRAFSEGLLPAILPMLQPTQPPHDRQVAICMFDDVAEFAESAALPLYQHFLPAMVEYIGDTNPSVRQAAVYGIGVCAQFGGEHMHSLIPDIVKRLNVVISHSESRSEDNVNATENAISALGKIIQFQSAAINAEEVLALWLSFLPVKEDKIEAIIIYNQLCTFIESNAQLVFGGEYQNAPKVMMIFAFILGSDLVDEALTQRIVKLLKGLPSQLVEGAVATLPAEQKSKLASFLA
ncbi:Importin-5 [Balamuthia mandrillaris]